MRDAAPQVINLKDYTPPAFLISTVTLDVDIRPAQASIRAALKCARNSARNAPGEPLVLDGDGLELVSVAIDGRNKKPTKTILRVGAGIFYDRVDDNLTLNARRFNGGDR